MAITPEFLAQQIEKAENIQAVFDQQILPQEGEPAEGFQQRKQTLIDQTMALVGKGPQMPTVNPKVLDIPIIMDCLGTPLTEGYVDSEGKTYDVSNLAQIPENLRWQNNGKPVVNRALNDNLDIINEQFLKTMIAKQWIMENIQPEQQKAYLQQTATVNDDDDPGCTLQCPILFVNFGPEQKAFIYEDGYSVSYAQQPKSPFTNLPLEKGIGTPNLLLSKLAADYAAARAEYKQMIQQHLGLQNFVEAAVKEHKEKQKNREQAIQRYTRYLGIRRYLQLEKNGRMGVLNENFKKMDDDCLFTMGRIKEKYPDIEEQITSKEIEQAEQAFKDKLNKVPLEILYNYDRVRNALSDLADKVNVGSLDPKEADKAIEKQKTLFATQKELESAWPEIRYKLLLAKARGTLNQPKDNLRELSLRERTGKTGHRALFFNNRDTSSVRSNSNAGSSFSERFSTVVSQAFSQFFHEPAPAAQSPAKSYDYLFKASLVGDSGVGKSSLLQRFSGDASISALPCISGVVRKKIIFLNESYIQLQTWDSVKEWQQREAIMGVMCPTEMDALIIAFAVNDKKSFDNIQEWHKKAVEREFCVSKDVVPILVATKCDIPEAEWEVTKEAIIALAYSLRLNVFFTSTKDNFGLTQLFRNVATSILEQKNISLNSNRM